MQHMEPHTPIVAAGLCEVYQSGRVTRLILDAGTEPEDMSRKKGGPSSSPG